MSTYQLVRGNTLAVIRLEDRVTIPFDPRNVNYNEYLDWLALGNAPLPADPAPVPAADDLDAQAAGLDALVSQVANMTIPQIAAFIDSTFPTLTAPQRKTLFVFGVTSHFVAKRWLKTGP